MPATADALTLDQVEDLALATAARGADGFLPEPYRTAVLLAARAITGLLRPELVEVHATADTQVILENE